MSADPTDRRARAGDRRVRAIGVGVALVAAIGAGSVFWLLSADAPSTSTDSVPVEPTERAVASLPAPTATPRPVEAYFPEIDGLVTAEVDESLIRELEERLRPLDGDYVATRHRELRQDDQPVAIISLLRVDEPEAAGLHRNALDGLGELFETVDDGRVADEPVVRAERRDGAALLWLPDTGSVLVVSAVDADRAEAVLTEIIGSVRGETDHGDGDG